VKKNMLEKGRNMRNMKDKGTKVTKNNFDWGGGGGGPEKYGFRRKILTLTLFLYF
jgi:hypothetical protein